MRHLNENLRFEGSSWVWISEESSQIEIQVCESSYVGFIKNFETGYDREKSSQIYKPGEDELILSSERN